MKERLTISEMAKLRGLTSETLRHYDRVGLFKPRYVDISSGYRYYSIYQYEMLGTIKELRELGMSIDEIKVYFEERNLKKSLSILEKKHEELQVKLKELINLEQNIKDKINFMKEISQVSNLHEIEHKWIPKRSLILKKGTVSTNLELSYGVIELENVLQEVAPIVGTNRLGVLIDKKDLLRKDYNASSTLFVTARELKEYAGFTIHTTQDGEFICSRYSGELWDREGILKKLISYIEIQGYSITGPALQIAHIDNSVTDVPSEIIFEIQVPVKKDEE
ncbi:MerR family transcriptional regulator [Paenibacillus urinalis]|uniref:MerR family transcriptional regulator n=1 Tax=Paenibacillus urinalis TaxID=521520 RepID=UPI00195FEF29